MKAERPRVLVLVTLAEVGGAQTYVASLVDALAEHYDVVVAAHGPGPLPSLVEAKARFVPLNHVRWAINPFRDLLGLVELLRLCRRERPLVVHANTSKAGFLGLLAARLLRVPVRLFTVHQWPFGATGGLRGRVYLAGYRVIARLATRSICVSESERSVGVAAGVCPAGRVTVIPNGVDVQAFPQATPSRSPARIISVGRLREPKDFHTLVEAFADVDAQTFEATIVGTGPDLESVRADLHRRALSNVAIAGERADVPELLADSDIFVLSSRAEGLPLSVVEAMAAGLPVVASAVGGVPELVVHGETGMLVPPGDAHALAEAIRQLVADPDLRLRLGGAARRVALERFDMSAFRDAHLELYRSELAAHVPGAARP
jgi:glycosyltransferase involved in cell wall biosynthesis